MATYMFLGSVELSLCFKQFYWLLFFEPFVVCLLQLFKVFSHAIEVDPNGDKANDTEHDS